MVAESLDLDLALGTGVEVSVATAEGHGGGNGNGREDDLRKHLVWFVLGFPCFGDVRLSSQRVNACKCVRGWLSKQNTDRSESSGFSMFIYI